MVQPPHECNLYVHAKDVFDLGWTKPECAVPVVTLIQTRIRLLDDLETSIDLKE